MIFEHTTSKVSFTDVIIRPLVFFYANGWVPATLLQSIIVSVTLFQTDGISATTMQAAGVSYTPVQLGGVSDLTRKHSVIGFSLRQSNFSSLLYTAKECPIYLPQRQIYVQSKRFYSRIKQIYVQLKQFLPSSQFGYDNLGKFPCNQFWISLTVRGEC